MGVRERKIEDYFRSQIESLGGITRKIMKTNRSGFPDQLAIVHGEIYIVEVKTISGVLSSVQEREIRRLRNAGATVYVAFGREGVDNVIRDINREGSQRFFGDVH